MKKEKFQACQIMQKQFVINSALVQTCTLLLVIVNVRFEVTSYSFWYHVKAFEPCLGIKLGNTTIHHI